MSDSATPSGRVGFLDEIRGLDLIAMTYYHGVYDAVFIFGVSMPAFHGFGYRLFQLCIASVFILISGASCQFSRSNLRRGLQTLGVAMLMTAGTFLVMYDQRIVFGVLHFMGCAMMIYGLAGKFLRRIPPVPGMLLMLLLWQWTWNTSGGYWSLGPLTVALPRVLYGTRFLFPLGFVGPGFFSADYFPLLPWLFLFFAGSYLGMLFQQGKMPRGLYKTHVPFLARLGRRSLLIYVLHQPLLYGVLWVYFSLLAG